MTWPFSHRTPRGPRRTPRSAFLYVEKLEERDVPAGFFLTGVGSATSPPEPFARLYDASEPTASSAVVGPGNINAFPGFAGAVRVASGDVNGDGIDDIIVGQGPGPGSGSQVKIFDGFQALFNNTTSQIASFFVYSDAPGVSQNPGFGGGVFVASADFNGDGFDELVVSPGAGARGHVKVFNFNDGVGGFRGSNPELRSSFFAYTDFAGEIRVSTLRFNNQSFLVTGSGAGTTQSDVRAYGNNGGGAQNPYNIGQVADGTFVPPALQFFPFPGYVGGVSVAAGDTNNDGNDELFVSKNDGISVVRVFDIAAVMGSGSSTPSPSREFQAFDGFTGEVRLGAADVDGDGQVEVLTSTGSSPGANGSHIKAWNVANAPTTTRSFFAYQGYVGGVWLSTNDYTFEQQFTSTDTPAAITDNGLLVTRSTITVSPQTQNDTTLTPKSIEVDLKISKVSGGNFAEDLDVRLVAPDGTPLFLFTDVNSGGSGFDITLTDDTAAPLIPQVAPTAGTVLTGVFRPEAPASLFGTFGNTVAAGNWRLQIQDDTASGVFQLDSWTIRFVF